MTRAKRVIRRWFGKEFGIYHKGNWKHFERF